MKSKKLSEILKSGEKIMSDETYKELRDKFIREVRERKSLERQCLTTLSSVQTPYLSRVEDSLIKTDSISSLKPVWNQKSSVQ